MIDLHEIAFVDIFLEGQAFRPVVRWADYLALDFSVHLTTLNLAVGCDLHLGEGT